jgi:hypothetical protein
MVLPTPVDDDVYTYEDACSIILTEALISDV